MLTQVAEKTSQETVLTTVGSHRLPQARGKEEEKTGWGSQRVNWPEPEPQ